MIVESLAPLAVPIESLTPLPGNPRRGDVDAVAASLRRFGQRKPIVVTADGTIVAGNHTWLAAKQLGWSEIAVARVEDDEATARAFALADNRTAELGDYDESLLLDLIRAVGDVDPSLLADSGWDEESVQALVDRIDPGLPDTPPSDDAPPPPPDPFSKPGDVWVLGGHRVVCGDATDVGAYDLLLSGEKVDCVWTDPPYGINYTGGSRARMDGSERSGIQNDALAADELTDLLHAALGATFASSKPGAAWYVAFADNDGPLQAAVGTLSDLGVYRYALVWVKDHFVISNRDYHSRHELLLYGWHPGAARLCPVTDRTQQTVIEVARPKVSKDHPTMKPVELVARCLANSAPRGGLVLDPFGGSGSTLLACEYTGRKARLIELDPRYVDVICRRWQEFTGAKPVLEQTGEPHDFTGGDDA